MNIWKCIFLFLFCFSSCREKEIILRAVSYSQFELFVSETKYITDAEKYGWSIVQLDVFNFKKTEHASWKKPDGINKVSSGKLPVTQVSYNDALAYCKWAKKRLPSYDEYWEIVKNDSRVIISENKFPISEIDSVNIVGNVWDLTKNKNNDLIRLAGGSLFCSESTCHGTIKERELFVDKETGNIHIGFCVIDLSKITEIKSFEIGKTVSNLDDRIWAVFQDSQDNYWFGSNGKGLYHFDGKVLKLITSKDGLIDNTIRGIQEDDKGNILIETPKGVSKFNGENFTTLKVIQSENNQWKLEPNDLWFNCNGNANNVYRYDGENLYELQLPKKDIKNIFGINKNEISYSPYSVYGIDKDKKGNIWFGTVLAGAFRFDGKSFLWIGEKELTRLEDGREPGVRSILEDKNGDIWLSNFKSKYKIVSNSDLNYEKLKAVELSDQIIKENFLYFNSGLIATNGDLWMTTYGGGVWNYDGKALSNSKIHIGKEDVLLISIFQDNVGTIWLGTDNDGVYKQNGGTFEKFALK